MPPPPKCTGAAATEPIRSPSPRQPQKLCGDGALREVSFLFSKDSAAPVDTGTACNDQQTHTNPSTMPTTKTVTAYTFDELSEQAKDKAREWMREQTFSDTDWAQFVEEDAEQAGAKLIEWDADRGAAKVKMDDPDSTAEYILTNHGKQCDTWTAADNYTAAMTEASKEQDDDERGEAIEMVRADFYAELGAAYGATMRKEYEYRQSDEATDEDIRANDYLFTEEGRRSVTL